MIATTTEKKRTIGRPVMKTPANISNAALTEWLRAHYGLVVTHLKFMPLGECSWAYLVDDMHATRYVFKLVQKGICGDGQLTPRKIKTLMALYYDYGIKQMTPPPLRARTGQYLNGLGAFTGCLLPYIAGTPAARHPTNEGHGRKLGALLGALHRCKLAPHEYPPQEDFASDIPQNLAIILQEVQHPVGYYTPSQSQFLALLRAILPQVNALLAEFYDLQAALQVEPDLAQTFVICHGEPSAANVIITPEDDVYLIDWDRLTLAPRERDLFYLQGDPVALEAYQRLCEGCDMRQDILRYYHLSHDLGEIVNYGSRLLFTRQSESQNTHDLDAVRHHIQGLRAP